MNHRLVRVLFFSLFVGACDERSPEDRRLALHLPPAGFKGDPARGVAHFNRYCAVCHGPGAKGTDQGPPLIHPIYRPAHHADLAFHLAVKNGVVAHHWSFGDMKPVPEVTPEMTADILAYLRRLQRQAPDE